MVSDVDKVDLNEFLEEMVRLIDERLRKQETAIARIDADVKRINRTLEKPSEKDNRIDKSVLRILRQ